MPFTVRNPQGIATLSLASSRFARHYFGNLGWFLFLLLLRCFSSESIPSYSYVFTARWLHITAAGFPHSEICGSMDICSSPQLIAACRVLLRLLMPRHSPYALINLTFILIFYSWIIWVSVCFPRNCISFDIPVQLLWLSLEITYFNSRLFRSALFSFQGACATL